MLVNKVKFPTFKHLRVNYKEIENDDLLKGYELLDKEFNQSAVTVTNGAILTRTAKPGVDWTLEQDNLIIEENSFVQSGIAFKNPGKQAHKLKVLLKKNSKARIFFLYDLEDSKLIGDVDFELQENSRLELALMFFNGSDVLYNIHANLNEEDAKIHMEGAYFCGNGNKYDINLEVNHNSPRTESELNMNGVLDDGAKKVYKYCIDFPRGSYDAKGDENETVVALGKNFDNTTVPILLVGEDTIEASHGATLEEPSEAVLDYIRSRGVDDIMTEVMCAQAKFAYALDLMDKETKQKSIDRLIEVITLRKQK